MDFEVEVINGRVYARAYIGEDIDVVIPEEINQISSDAFSYVSKKRNLRNIYINSKYSYPIEGCYFENIYVDDNNPYMCSVDGVLYSKDKKTLLSYPCLSKRTSYKVLDSTEKISSYAFMKCKLEEIILNDNLKRIESGAFKSSKKLKRINFPDSVTYIGLDALNDCFDIEEVRFPSKLDEICDYFRIFSKDGIGSYERCLPNCIVKNVYIDFSRLRDNELRICALKGGCS